MRQCVKHVHSKVNFPVFSDIRNFVPYHGLTRLYSLISSGFCFVSGVLV